MTLPEERMAICKTCDFFINKTTTCKKCGCFMILKTKILSSQCPIGKWDKFELKTDA